MHTGHGLSQPSMHQSVQRQSVRFKCGVSHREPSSHMSMSSRIHRRSVHKLLRRYHVACSLLFVNPNHRATFASALFRSQETWFFRNAEQTPSVRPTKRALTNFAKTHAPAIAADLTPSVSRSIIILLAIAKAVWPATRSFNASDVSFSTSFLPRVFKIPLIFNFI